MVKHVLKDGTVLEDITGHVVKEADCPMVYALLERIERERNEEKETGNA